jgi:F-type H+-transporting ATPase subunit b|tara:strand:+ start:1160 stop:1651 length:492 start_codon:yes stop_codon:yes gene_type:complete
MNTFYMLATQLLAMTEGAGGLFDFNATLPLMAIQFVLLMVVLTFIFYKPVSKVLEDREEYISGNLTQASDKLIKADELYKQYDEQLKTAKVNAQATIAKAEKEAKDSVALEIGEARADAAKLIERTNKELEAQKSTALAQLETQVDELSQLIKEKLLGKEVVL